MDEKRFFKNSTSLTLHRGSENLKIPIIGSKMKVVFLYPWFLSIVTLIFTCSILPTLKKSCTTPPYRYTGILQIYRTVPYRNEIPHTAGARIVRWDKPCEIVPKTKLLPEWNSCQNEIVAKMKLLPKLLCSARLTSIQTIRVQIDEVK